MNSLRYRFVIAICSWLFLVCVSTAARAEEPRRLNLPARVYNYARRDWPKHVREVAEQFDNTPPDNPVTNHGATLGRVLFYDTHLSRNKTTSCASCHQQKYAFTDPRRVSVGFDGREVSRNSMSLINSRFYKRGRFFWDERAETLEDQVLMPIENEIEMGHSLPKLLEQLRRDPIYPPLFRNAFGDEAVTSKRIARALAQFIRAMVAFDSKYDRGREQVGSVLDDFPNYTAQENLGKRQFFGRARCAECHLPDEREKADDFGLVELRRDRQSAFFFLMEPQANGIDTETTDRDGGVGSISHRKLDIGRFKASSLRNIAVTAPYMHDGRFSTIDAVLEHYNWSVGPHPNLDPRLADFAANGLALPEREKVALAVFLQTLMDETLLKNPAFSNPFEE